MKSTRPGPSPPPPPPTYFPLCAAARLMLRGGGFGGFLLLTIFLNFFQVISGWSKQFAKSTSCFCAVLFYLSKTIRRNQSQMQNGMKIVIKINPHNLPFPPFRLASAWGVGGDGGGGGWGKLWCQFRLDFAWERTSSRGLGECLVVSDVLLKKSATEWWPFGDCSYSSVHISQQVCIDTFCSLSYKLL
jgi:hypothetical protein